MKQMSMGEIKKFPFDDQKCVEQDGD